MANEEITSGDEQSIQGLWHLLADISRGKPGYVGTNYFHFDGDRFKIINPQHVNGGEWSTFELDSETEPKRFTRTWEWIERGETYQRIDRWLYHLDGDTLQLCCPSIFGRYPDIFSDQEHGVYTLERYLGPPPATKQPSGKKPIQHPVLGLLTWSDNYNWWEGEMDIAATRRVKIRLEPDYSPNNEATITAGEAFILWLRQHEHTVRQFAAAEMLDTFNDTWSDDRPISAQTFMERITLDSVSMNQDGSAEMYYNDGEMFWGHTILVSIGENREFRSADLAG